MLQTFCGCFLLSAAFAFESSGGARGVGGSGPIPDFLKEK